jgi:hypothetical protein
LIQRTWPGIGCGVGRAGIIARCGILVAGQLRRCIAGVIGLGRGAGTFCTLEMLERPLECLAIVERFLTGILRCCFAAGLGAGLGLWGGGRVGLGRPARCGWGRGVRRWGRICSVARLLASLTTLPVRLPGRVAGG